MFKARLLEQLIERLKFPTLRKAVLLRRVVEWMGTNECFPKLILLMLLTATCYKIKFVRHSFDEKDTENRTLSVGDYLKQCFGESGFYLYRVVDWSQ